MKKRKWLFRIFLLGLIILTPLAWYHGFIPVASGKTKAGLRHALQIKLLPSSMKINSSGSESWTDYILEADCTIKPEQFNSLIAGRKFEKSTST
ncbi:MAG: hypothetical protein ACSHX6_03750 [Akkermansiaceae bacterium]